MSGLVISLRPYEKVLVGGVVLQNGQRRGQLRVLDERAGVLRLSEAIHPDRAVTPLTRAYYAAQVIVSGDGEEAAVAPVLLRLLSEAREGFDGFAFAGDLDRAREAAADGLYVRVMRVLRPLLPQEAAILADPKLGLSEAARPLRLAETPKAAARAAVEAAVRELAELRAEEGVAR